MVEDSLLFSGDVFRSHYYDKRLFDDLVSIEEQNMIDILEENDGILIGTPTINADAPKLVWDLLSCMMYLEKEEKLEWCLEVTVGVVKL